MHRLIVLLGLCAAVACSPKEATSDEERTITTPSDGGTTAVDTAAGGDSDDRVETTDEVPTTQDDDLDTADTAADETCADLIDNDGDGWIDMEDPRCQQDKVQQEDDGYSSWYLCNDGLDNDGDGDVDAEDEDCTDPYGGEEADEGRGDETTGDGEGK